MARPRIVYLHGDGVMRWSYRWVSRLATTLAGHGFPTFFETFPDSIEARAEYWLPFLAEHVRAGRDDVLVGWSAGAVAAMRYAHDQPVRGLALIAPYYTDLGLEAVRRSGFVAPGWDWSRLRANTSNIAMFHSDADPYVSQAELHQLATMLGATTYRITGAGHFADLDEFPELEDHLLDCYR